MSDLNPLAPSAPSRGIEAFRRLALSLSLSSLFIALFSLLASTDESVSLAAFFLSPFRSRTMFPAILEAAAPLAICALGALMAFRAGHFTLGGEGQVYAGAFAGAAAGIVAPAGSLGLAAAMTAGVLGGMLVAAPSAAGRRFTGADVLLTSFLVSQAAIFGIDWAIGGPLRDPVNNLVAMRAIPGASLLQRIAPPSTLTLAPLVALVLVLLAWAFLSGTRSGARLTLYGKNRMFARLQGFPVDTLSWLPIVIAGGAHGLAGAMLSLGANGTAVRGISGGLGWSAIGVALIAGNEPVAVPFAALLFAWLDAGARQASILSDLPPDAAMVIKALVILTATARPALRGVRRLAGENSGR
ncbi:MAG: ABC transporter permease, partial [Spirochaetales bacterium]